MELQQLVRFDELTGLYNRRYLLERLTQEIQRARRYRSPLSLLMLDVDHFKRINDTHGHIVGDTVLAAIAAELQRALRATDIPARYGGEELCIVLPETQLDGAYLLAERLRHQIAALTFTNTGGQTFLVTCSIGAAMLPDRAADSRAFLALADGALYQAKAHGRNCVVLAPLAL